MNEKSYTPAAKREKAICIKVRPDVYEEFKKAVKANADTVCNVIQTFMISYTTSTFMLGPRGGYGPTQSISITNVYGGPPRSPKKFSHAQQTLPPGFKSAPERPPQRCYVCGSQTAVVLGSYVNRNGHLVERPLCASCQKAAEASGRWEGFKPL